MCQALCWAPIPGALWCPPGSGSRPRPRAFLERKGQGQLSSGGRKNTGFERGSKGLQESPTPGCGLRGPTETLWQELVGGQEGRMEGKGRSLLSSGSQLPGSPHYRVQMPSSSAAPSLEPFWVLCAGLVRAHLGVFGERRAGHLLWGRPWLCCLRGPAGPRGSPDVPQAACWGWAGVGGWGGQGGRLGGPESCQASEVNPFPVPAVSRRPGECGWGYPEDCGLGHVYSHLLGKHQAAPRTSWRG